MHDKTVQLAGEGVGGGGRNPDIPGDISEAGEEGATGPLSVPGEMSASVSWFNILASLRSHERYSLSP